MSEGIRKYILISATILCVLFSFVLCWVFKEIFIFVWIFTYFIGIINGMILIGVNNYDE